MQMELAQSTQVGFKSKVGMASLLSLSSLILTVIGCYKLALLINLGKMETGIISP